MMCDVSFVFVMLVGLSHILWIDCSQVWRNFEALVLKVKIPQIPVQSKKRMLETANLGQAW